jgi:predicted transport protein
MSGSPTSARLSEVAVLRVALVNAPLRSAVCDHGVGHQRPPGLLMVGGALEDHAHLSGPMLELFEHSRKRVLNLDSSVREEVLKLYVAYKATTNFVDVVPQKSRLRRSLNMDFDEVHDPKGLCKDVTGLGRWGNGDVEIGLSSIDQLDDVMELVKQSFENQLGEEGE